MVTDWSSVTLVSLTMGPVQHMWPTCNRLSRTLSNMKVNYVKNSQRDTSPMLSQCWACVADDGPALSQFWHDVPCPLAQWVVRLVLNINEVCELSCCKHTLTDRLNFTSVAIATTTPVHVSSSHKSPVSRVGLAVLRYVHVSSIHRSPVSRVFVLAALRYQHTKYTFYQTSCGMPFSTQFFRG